MGWGYGARGMREVFTKTKKNKKKVTHKAVMKSSRGIKKMIK